MKNFIAMLLTLVLVLSMSTVVFATENPSVTENISTEASSATSEACEEVEETSVPRLSDGIPGGGDISSPLDYWNTNGWPDDVSFAYEAGGEMAKDGTILAYWEIGLVNASDERKAEITELFSSNCLITFHNAEWSHNQRERALNEIGEDIKKSHDNNFVLFDLSKNTDNLYVFVKDEVLEEYSARYFERYGELVQVLPESAMAKDMGYVEGYGLNGGTQSKQNAWFMPVLLSAFILVFGTVLLKNSFKPVSARVTSTGAVVTDSGKPTRKEIVNAVSKSTYSPRDEVFESIKSELNR